jgi:hypothetical protein
LLLPPKLFFSKPVWSMLLQQVGVVWVAATAAASVGIVQQLMPLPLLTR